MPTDVTVHGITATDWGTLFALASFCMGALTFGVLFGRSR